MTQRRRPRPPVTVGQLASRLRRELAHCLTLTPAGSADARIQGQREMVHHLQAFLRNQLPLQVKR